MTGGVKGPNGPLYTPNTSPNDEDSSSPVINTKPQIPRAPSQAPQKSILKNRSAQKTIAKPRANKEAREKVELETRRQNLVTQLEHLLTQKQFFAYKDALIDAIANPDALPDDFTIVYIDEHGREVTVIPPDPQLQQNPDQEIRLRQALKLEASKLEEHFNDEGAEKINRAIITTSRQFDECNARLQERGADQHPEPDTPQKICLDSHFLTSPPGSVPPPVEDTFVLEDKPTVKKPKKTHFNEEQFSEQWIHFYSSPTEKVPGQFHTLNNIRQFSDNELEHVHDYIQLLFPNKHISEVNPGAPRLTNELARTIRETSALQNAVLDSVDQMLKFWGLERHGNTVTINQDEVQRHNKWDGQFDHNHKRITRMLDFLMVCGQVRLAKNIEHAMQSQRIAQQQTENIYWAKAVGRQSGAPEAFVARPEP